MKIFISYSRKDEAVAHLLSYILERKGIKCLLDRKLDIGKKFDLELQEMIQQANLVLLLLTNSAAESPWVNQEIGFAIAHNKLIWPVAIEKNIKPHGMLNTTQSYSMFDWSNPSLSIDRLVGALRKDMTTSDRICYFKDFGFNQILQGKLERTHFIISALKELREEKNRKIDILCQAAFSVFAVSDDLMYRVPGEHTEEYITLVLQEQDNLNKLISLKNCNFKLILWPVRAYETKYLAVRYQNLLKWMEMVKGDPSIEYVCAQYPGPNRLIIKDEFLLEGFKLHNQSGYQMNVVKYEPGEIKNSYTEFKQTFDRNYREKKEVIEQIRAMYKKATEMWPSSG